MSTTPRFLLKVFLYQIEPEIWRRFSIPATATFKQLHEAVQQAMGWQDKHWHEFRHGKGKHLLDVIGPDHEEVEKGENFQEENKVTLRDAATFPSASSTATTSRTNGCTKSRSRAGRRTAREICLSSWKGSEPVLRRTVEGPSATWRPSRGISCGSTTTTTPPASIPGK